jgi:hypothetical protein
MTEKTKSHCGRQQANTGFDHTRGFLPREMIKNLGSGHNYTERKVELRPSDGHPKWEICTHESPYTHNPL